MKKIDALMKGRKFTEKLFGIKKRSINRNLEGAIDDLERQKEQATLDYENLLIRLADDNVNYKDVINQMINKKQIISDADNTMELICNIKEDLNSEAYDDDYEDL